MSTRHRMILEPGTPGWDESARRHRGPVQVLATLRETDEAARRHERMAADLARQAAQGREDQVRLNARIRTATLERAARRCSCDAPLETDDGYCGRCQGWVREDRAELVP